MSRIFTADRIRQRLSDCRRRKGDHHIGSVGQPRDRDNRASYVYVEENEVHFVRLEYDYKTTAEKIRALGQLDTFNADRLEEGR